MILAVGAGLSNNAAPVHGPSGRKAFHDAMIDCPEFAKRSLSESATAVEFK